jgi:hypothetical protein
VKAGISSERYFGRTWSSQPSTSIANVFKTVFLSQQVKVKWAILFVSAVCLLTLIFTVHLYFGCSQVRRPVSWSQAMQMTVSRSYVWILLSPLISWLAKRFSFTNNNFWTSLGVHAVTGLIFAGMKAEVDYLTTGITHPISNGSSVVAYQLDVLIYWAIIGASLSFYYHHFYNEYQKSMLQSSQLEARLAQAHLQVLKMQLHPHFLFNTLNAISTLVYKDPSAADRMISRLGELLRFAIDSIRLEEIPLRNEIALLEIYLDIERTRFGDRLAVTLQLDRCAENAKVPSLILQPIVENAIQHGIGRRARGGRIDVRTRLSGKKIEIEVQDDGLGFIPRNNSTRVGVGLANTRLRLQALYGEDYGLECSDAPERGALIKLTIPYCSAEIPNEENLRIDR